MKEIPHKIVHEVMLKIITLAGRDLCTSFYLECVGKKGIHFPSCAMNTEGHISPGISVVRMAAGHFFHKL